MTVGDASIYFGLVSEFADPGKGESEACSCEQVLTADFE